MVSTILVQCLLASTLYLLPVSDARASPRDIRYALQPRADVWTYVGCYTDVVGDRSLTTNPGTTGGTAALTVELCESTCLGLGYTLAGMEYAGECYCGNAISNGGTLATSGCTMACNGNSSEICGGSDRLSVYSYGAAVSSAITASSTNSTLSSTKSVSSTSTSPISSSKSVIATSTSKVTSSSSASALPVVSSTKSSMPLTSTKSTSSSLVSISQQSSSKSTSSVSLSKLLSSTSSVSSLEKTSSVTSSLSSIKSSSSSLLSSKISSSSLVSSLSLKASSSVVSSSVKSSSSLVSSSSTHVSTSRTLVSSSSSKTSSVSVISSSASSTPVPSSSITTSVSSSTALTSSTKSVSSSQPIPAGWYALGCYTDNTGARTLTDQIWTLGDDVTVETCEAACLAAGYTYAGVEYADQCFCDNSIENGNTLNTAGACTMACQGNATEICGGPNAINIYSYSNGGVTTATTTSVASKTTSTTVASASAIAGWTSIGCYSDVVGDRTLETEIYTITAAMTVELCLAACQAASFTLAGLEYAGECYCDTKIANGGVLETSGCTMACNGNAAEICGGPDRLSVYSYNSSGISVTTATSVSVSATGTATAMTSASAVGVATSLPTGWIYEGCWVDEADGRILSYQAPTVSTLTVESCVQACVAAGYTVAGMEYYTQCYCGDALINKATKATETDCNTACGGNSAEMCGGGDRMSIYSNQTILDVAPIPVVQNTSLPGNWAYQGCLVDNAVDRVFYYQIENTDNNTAEACLTQCATYGYGAGGMEYGYQCFCGDYLDVINAGAAYTEESACTMPCSGNDSYLCGGPDLIQFYLWEGTQLDSWTFESGNDAGIYEFLIGGVIIPLISTPGVNGKINFLEKFGTEPANNSTGAYQLDLASLDNFTAAWQPLHVKTDVFCSAGLTLPDKAGRQLNIGGWANDATYGIRLYWPDGSPGVWGTNDWQENVDEVSLQKGRWYPSAMMMTNGSILVVGGEEGSNGPPVPSLEVLPFPEGGEVIYCDYLNRTDPYNLYPFLAVLPSGGILVAYYNEARILNEVTLETERVLPNMPGAVDDFLGGRTYPFEGTAMILPQYAPYTDPITVIICGGSVPGPEIALDNCVSIQPEVAGANWTIERMPSKRVISSIVALPDGTYLINNGAKQGRAGFGLATEPNFNAVLYDPTKPVHNRMSVMANTTIYRLYHSESVLLQDGRVLVSGSDPEDLRFIQEYRIETYTPPYLLSGLTQPTYTLSTTDIAYGETFTVTVKLFQGTTSTMRISLMAAVSSTHGNSMGQRTLFPAFTCEGDVCTVTAPPNAHVSPPAWHMLFVLDGPTPSVAQWVRIGGDPGELGNWPDFPDFDVPGI